MPNPHGTPVIGDLVACDQGLDIHCAGCGRDVYLTPLEACLIVGEDLTFAEANRRLRCSACGAKGREKMIHARPSMVDFYRQARAAGLGVG